MQQRLLLFMLWHSITAGLGIVRFWQTYAVAVGVTVIVVLPKLYLALLKDRFMYGNDVQLSPAIVWYLIRHHWMDGFEKLKDRAFRWQFAGGMRSVVFVGLLELLGSYFAILTLLPLMTGTGTSAAWGLPWTLPFHDTVVFLKLLGAWLLTLIIVCSVPVVGEMLVSPIWVAVSAYLLGITSTFLLPSFWLGCGFLLAGVALRYAVIGLISIVVAFLPISPFSIFSRVSGFILLCLLPILNFLPAFFYAGWLSQK